MTLRVWRSLEEVERPLPHPVVTIGNFDGVHLGHQAILSALAKRAPETGGISLVLTFDPHPVRVLAPEREIHLLTPLAQKIALFEASGLETLLVLPFTLDLSRLSPEDFVRRVLVEGLGVKDVLVGENFRFGYRQAGNAELLSKLAARMGFRVELVAPVRMRGEVVSSTRIRNLIARGCVGLAARLLGRLYSVEGPIVPGRGIGRAKTVPTLNMAPYPELLPLSGVYITETESCGRRDLSVTNIGLNPTFGETVFHLESHLLEASPEGPEPAPGQAMRVFFHRRIRDEMKFPSAEALRERIGRDIADAHRYFRRRGRIRNAECGMRN